MHETAVQAKSSPQPPQSTFSLTRRPWDSDYDFAEHYLDLDGLRLHYVDEGPRDATPVIMVHGNPTWSFFWRRQLQSLPNDFRAIAVDHMGCGKSDKPTDYPYCLAQHIANLTQLIDHLDLQRAVLVAHDWGGAIGLGALLRRQERFQAITLLNTGAFPPPYIPWRIRVCRWPLVGRIGVQGLNLFARAAIRMATEQEGGLPAQVADGFLAPYDCWSNRTAIYRFVKDIPTSSGHPTWNLLEQIEQGLAGLKDLPIQFIWGMRDWCFRPECLERFRNHWPQARVLEIADAGHYVVEDAPDQVQSCLAEFLQSLD